MRRKPADLRRTLATQSVVTEYECDSECEGGPPDLGTFHIAGRNQGVLWSGVVRDERWEVDVGGEPGRGATAGCRVCPR